MDIVERNMKDLIESEYNPRQLTEQLKNSKKTLKSLRFDLTP